MEKMEEIIEEEPIEVLDEVIQAPVISPTDSQKPPSEYFTFY